MEYFLKELEQITKTGFWEVDLKNQTLFWSDETYRIHKVPVGEKLDVSTAINYYHPDDRELITEVFTKCVEEAQEYNVRLRIINRDNEMVHVQAQGRPILEDGKIVKVFGTFKDLSEEVEMKRQNRKSISEYYILKKAINEFAIVVETNKDGEITYANENFTKISKYSEEELIGKTHRIVNSGFHPKDFFQEMWKTISSGVPWSGQVCNKAKDGSIYWVDTFIVPMFDLDREIVGYTAFRFDITQKIEAEEMLIEEQEKANLMSQLASIGELSANIAHEIKNPLTVIQANSSNLMKLLQNPEKLEKAQGLIQKSTNRINKIVKGLQRLSHNSKDDEFQESNFKDLMDETVGFCQEALRHHHILLQYEKIEEDILISCNEMKISQVVLNLINNAKDALLESKSDERWIKIETVNEEKSIKVFVTDSGKGIPEDIKAKIMEPFYTTKRVGKGTGLGLALISTFITEHNGEFYLDETSDNTCFVFSIPKFQKAKAV